MQALLFNPVEDVWASWTAARLQKGKLVAGRVPLPCPANTLDSLLPVYYVTNYLHQD
jgi:hypothetical protein